MKLLQRTVKSYLVYSLLVMVVAVPVFYFIIQALCVQDVDEALQDRKARFEVQLKSHPEIVANLPWHNINNEIVVYAPVDIKANDRKVTKLRYSTISGQEEPFRELHTVIVNGNRVYPVIFRISMIDIEDLIQGIVLTVILLMIVILGGLLWINRRQSKKLWKPFYQALDQLRQFSLEKKPSLQLASTNIKEFKDLHRSISQLTNRTYRTYLQQKEFTENASHELQTPLATLQAKLELLMQTENLNSQQAKLIQELNEAVFRMSRLNKGLLLLAKIENNQFTELGEIHITAVVRRLLNPLEMQIRLKRLSLSEIYQDVVIEANPVLMDILFSNLLNNALQHSPPDGRVAINLFAGRFEISNSGNPLPFPEEKLFRRFQRGDSGFAGGNGIGLAIVKQITDRCHYVIRYQYKNNMHRFEVEFGS
jgi:signal transduction histidine kinase